MTLGWVCDERLWIFTSMYAHNETDLLLSLYGRLCFNPFYRGLDQGYGFVSLWQCGAYCYWHKDTLHCNVVILHLLSKVKTLVSEQFIWSNAWAGERESVATEILNGDVVTSLVLLSVGLTDHWPMCLGMFSGAFETLDEYRACHS